VFVSFGVLWLLIEPAGLFFPEKFNWGWKGYAALLLLSLVVGLIRARPRRAISRKLPPSGVEIGVAAGDVFTRKGNVVVGTNDTFDTDTRSPQRIIASRSVQGQLLERIFRNDTEELDRQIDGSLAGLPYEACPAKTFGKQRRYAIGAVATVEHEDTRFFLPAFTTMSDSLPAHVESSLESLNLALTSVWEAIRKGGHREPVFVPVIGADLARLNLSKTLLIQIIVLSFVSSAVQRGVAPSLTVCVRDADIAEIDMAALDDWLRRLCAV